MSPLIQVAARQTAASPVIANNVINAAEANARFVVGQDPDGHWVAVEVHGRAGGLFRSREAAVDFAAGETDHRPDAVSVSAERIELRL